MCILLTANKKRSLPTHIVNELIKLLKAPFGDFIMLILSSCENNPELDGQSLEMLSLKLDSDFVVVEQENSMMKIEKRNRSNIGSTSIALLAAQFLLRTFENLKSMVSKTFRNFLFFIFSSKQKNVFGCRTNSYETEIELCSLDF